MRATRVFTFPLHQQSKFVCEFDCRATATVIPGAPPLIDYVNGGDPGWPAEVDEFCDVEVWAEDDWVLPDEYIREQVLKYLYTGAEDQGFIDEREEELAYA